MGRADKAGMWTPQRQETVERLERLVEQHGLLRGKESRNNKCFF